MQATTLSLISVPARLICKVLRSRTRSARTRILVEGGEARFVGHGRGDEDGGVGVVAPLSERGVHAKQGLHHNAHHLRVVGHALAAGGPGVVAGAQVDVDVLHAGGDGQRAARRILGRGLEVQRLAEAHSVGHQSTGHQSTTQNCTAQPSTSH